MKLKLKAILSKTLIKPRGCNTLPLKGKKV
jgi:hypothetical protein